MSRLTRDEAVEPVSRNARSLGANGDREIFIFPVQLTTSRIYVQLKVMTIYTYVHTYVKADKHINASGIE